VNRTENDPSPAFLIIGAAGISLLATLSYKDIRAAKIV
jgi:hypothetical protein